MNQEQLPIGQFARLCRLSVKQLRHYDTLGLLPAAWVDPRSGYRYYRPDQAKDAMLIALMRSLDVPLATIRQVLAGDLDELKLHRDNLESDLRRKQAAMATVERVLAKGLPRPEVTVLTEPDHPVVLAREIAADISQIGVVTSACVQRLLPRHRLIGLFPLDFTGPIPVEVAAVDPVGDLVLEGGVFASATHIGPYDQIGLTAHALLSWCASRGHLAEGPIREVYVSNPATTPVEHLVTHLMVQLEDR